MISRAAVALAAVTALALTACADSPAAPAPVVTAARAETTPTPMPSATPTQTPTPTPTPTPPPTPQPTGTTPPCGDPTAHVYHPYRLHLLAGCVTVTGTVAIIRRDADGDLHILLALDPGQEKYVNTVNVSQQHGDLVLEPVCVGEITQADAVDACAGYHNPLVIPTVGSHVSVTGAWVLDADHGWLEIHPVASFQ